MRKLLFNVHLYLGLIVGVLFALLGVTGSIVVFQDEIDQALNPALLRSVGSGEHRPLNEIVASARAHQPAGWELDFLQAPNQPDGVYTLWFVDPDSEPYRERFREVTVDPYTAAALGSRPYGEDFLGTVYALHGKLLAGYTGHLIVGFAGILLLVSAMTGIYLWWPRHRERFVDGLRIRLRRPWRRANWELHRAGGFYASILLAIVALSGIYIVFPDQMEAATRAVAPLDLVEGPVYSRTGAGPPFLAGDVWDRVRAAAPGAWFQGLSFPDSASATFRVFVGHGANDYQETSKSIYFVDQFSGEVLAVQDERGFGVLEHTFASMFVVHNGALLGSAGRVLVFLVGIAPLVLGVTGLIIWLLRRAPKRPAEEASAFTVPPR